MRSTRKQRPLLSTMFATGGRPTAACEQDSMESALGGRVPIADLVGELRARLEG